MKRSVDDLAPTTPAERAALAALARGHATEGQQRLATRWLLVNACGLLTAERGALSDGERHFMAGRRWVGLMFTELAGAKILGFPDDDRDAHEARNDEE